MRKILLTLVALAAVLVAPLAVQTPLAQTVAGNATSSVTVNARVIVKYRAAASQAQASASRPAGEASAAPQRAQALSARVGIALKAGRTIGEGAQVVSAEGISSAALAARLAADPDVEYAEPDLRRHPNALLGDPLYPGGQTGTSHRNGQWYLRAPDTTAVSAINAPAGWAVGNGSSQVVVAVLDSGARYDHPDLVGKLYPGYDFINDAATSNDGGGYDGDASDIGNWVTSAEVANDPAFAGCLVEDSSWHGTQIAGLIGAATDNGRGVAAVAPNVMVLPVRVLGKCGGFDSDIQAGMLWAAGLSNNPISNPHPAKVLNLSLGSAGPCNASYRDVLSRVAAAGVVVVISAGNDAGFATDTPANCPGVIAVAGLDHSGVKVSYSSLGPEIAISAPSGDCNGTIIGTDTCPYALLTTSNAGRTVPSANNYDSTIGTSFASPLVAATAALMLSVRPSLGPADIRNALRSSARPFPTSGGAAGTLACRAPTTARQYECYCDLNTCGGGMLDVGAALAAVAPALAPYVPLTASNANPAIGEAVELSALEATLAANGVGTYQWAVVGGDGSLGSSTQSSTARLTPRANGYLTVRLTLNDTVHSTRASADTTMLVGPPVSANPDGNRDLESSGGGALGAGWLLMLLAAVAALAASPRRA